MKEKDKGPVMFALAAWGLIITAIAAEIIVRLI